MATGPSRQVVHQISEGLCAALGLAVPSGQLHRLSRSSPGTWSAITVAPEDEELVAAVRQCLEQVIGALRTTGTESGRHHAVVALEGAELVLRGELAKGQLEEIPLLIPSFVFLVASPIVDQNQALELTRKASELVKGVLQSTDRA